MKELLIVVALCASAVAIADDVDQCRNIISAAKTTDRVISDQRVVEKQVEDFCSEYSQHQGDSESMSSGASYYFLSGNLGLSHAAVNDIASKYCYKSDHYAARSDSYQQYLESIAPAAFEAYKSCLEYAKAQVKFYVLGPAIKPRELTMYAHYASTYLSMKYALLQVSSQDGSSCKWSTTDSDTAKVLTGSTVKLHCTRLAQNATSYVTISNNNDAATEPFALTWPAYAADGTPIDTLKAVTTALTNMQNELAKVSAQAKRSADELTRAKANDARTQEIGGPNNYGENSHAHEECEKGQFVSGVHWWFAGEKLIRIAFECRDLVPPPPPPVQ